MKFDGSVATFEISIKDVLTHETYLGTFKVKCFLNPLEIIKTDRIYRDLIGSINPIMASEETKSLAFSISQLSSRIIESPDFFKNVNNPELIGGHLPSQVLIEVLNLAIDAESGFRRLQEEKMNKIQAKLTKSFKAGKIGKKQTEEETED